MIFRGLLEAVCIVSKWVHSSPLVAWVIIFTSGNECEIVDNWIKLWHNIIARWYHQCRSYQMYSEGGIGLYGEHEKVTMFPAGVDRDVPHDLSSILFSVTFTPFLKFLIGNWFYKGWFRVWASRGKYLYTTARLRFFYNFIEVWSWTNWTCRLWEVCFADSSSFSFLFSSYWHESSTPVIYPKKGGFWALARLISP